jgi:competence protein ComEC
LIAICNLFICTNYSIPVGKNNRYGHPNKEVLENLKKSKIYRTDQDGSIMFKIKNNKLKIETCNP